MTVSRRRFLGGVGAGVGALAVAAAHPDRVTDAFAASPPSAPSMSPDAALKRLAAGNRRFVAAT